MKERLFRFKQFSVVHSESAMKVGVDGVLIGAWATTSGCRILDVGTGCGLIALMLAQRYPDVSVLAIDVHHPSVKEAKENVERSDWSGRIEVSPQSLEEVREGVVCGKIEKFNLVVSNPPYFDSGVEHGDNPRLRARHQGELSPKVLVEAGRELLTEMGRLSMIFPSERYDEICSHASMHGMSLARACFVKDRQGKPEKRVMVEFMREEDMEKEKPGIKTEPEIEHIVMFDQGEEPTDIYRRLCGEFYLRF